MAGLDRKRLATAFVVVGVALIGGRVIALAAGDGDAGAPGPAPAPSPQTPRTDGSLPLRSASGAAAAIPVAPTALRLERLDQRRSVAADPQALLFEPQVWQAPSRPALPAEPAEAPSPQAPPFPYAYLGGMTEDRVRTAFFGRGDEVLSVRTGDTVDGAFRVDALDESRMTLTYLPLHQSMQLAFGVRR